MLLQCEGSMGSQIVRRDERKMKSPREGRR